MNTIKNVLNSQTGDYMEVNQPETADNRSRLIDEGFDMMTVSASPVGSLDHVLRILDREPCNAGIPLHQTAYIMRRRRKQGFSSWMQN